jgi:hypothetical protein
MSSQARFSGPRLDPGSYATQREGIPLANISQLGECPHCGQEVLRTAMVKSAVPIALEPSDAGVIAVWEDGRAQVLYGEDLRWAKVEGRELYLDHFADCVGRHEEAEVACYFAAAGIAEECELQRPPRRSAGPLPPDRPAADQADLRGPRRGVPRPLRPGPDRPRLPLPPQAARRLLPPARSRPVPHEDAPVGRGPRLLLGRAPPGVHRTSPAAAGRITPPREETAVPTIIEERLQKLPELHIDGGGHDEFEKGHCAMELVSWLAGEKFSDRPSCTSPVLSSFLVRLNDGLPEDLRQELKPYLPRVIGTAGDGQDEARGWLAADFTIRTVLPTWLELAGAGSRRRPCASCRRSTRSRSRLRGRRFARSARR